MKTNTRIDAMVPWRTDFDRQSPLFAPLASWLDVFREHSQWPQLADYQRLLDSLDQPVCTQSGVPLKVVPQAGKPDHFEQHYAPRIFTSGEIQTRSENWHDFFQLLSWLMFPRCKASINAIHIPRARERLHSESDPGRRSPMENMLSLFDEGGAVLVSSDESLFELVRNFRWKELFWQRRDELAQKFACVVFGHAMYEKGLTPYLGMTANAVFMPVQQAFFAQSQAQQLADIDAFLSALFVRGEAYAKPRDLQPFPLLGMPGWDAANQFASYYDNQNYFRPGRQAPKK